MTNRITILGSHDARLRAWLASHSEGHERGAIVLLRKFDRPVKGQGAGLRYVVVDVMEMDGDWVLHSSPTSLRINMRKLPDLYLRCEEEGLDLGFIHSHPVGAAYFSGQDEINEQNILRGLSGCNGPNAVLIAMVLCDGSWLARVRHAQNAKKAQPVRHVLCLGERLDLFGVAQPSGSAEILKRQEAAFGKPFNVKMQSLRAVIVGAGATGSATATLLARAGIGELILIDGDVLEETNLNRVRGYRKADLGQNKAKVLANYIRSLGLNITVSAIEEYLDQSPEAIDALSSADVVFGCTDDVAGRDILNQALYYYALAYVDMGLTGKIDAGADGEPYLRDHRGRISCILPEYGACLRCQRVVTDMKLKYERAIAERPILVELDAETLAREYYLVGGGEQAPGVGPFTSATADAAVATLMDLIKPFRSLRSDLRRDNIWHDFVHLSIHSNEPDNNAECIYCRQRALLVRDEGRFRLEMPSLGALR